MSLRKIKRAIARKIRQLLFWATRRFAKSPRWADDFRQLADELEEKREREFLRNTDFTKLDTSGYKPMYISTGTFRFQTFTTFFLKDMLSYCVYCLYKHYLPRVDVCTRSDEKRNIWELHLEQPFYRVRGEVADGTRDGYCTRVRSPFNFPQFPTEDDVKLYSKLVQPPFFELNEETSAYVEQEYRQLFFRGGVERLRVCGVLCRGTDYHFAKDHPVQPPVSDVIALVREKMQELNCEYVYLATEEYAIQKQFDEAFPGKVLINKRMYYDQYWDLVEQKKGTGTNVWIRMIHNDRENDNYYRGLEYLSSMILLSRCQALIAGSCGGSRTALYMNGGKYEYWHLFNLGLQT